MSHSDIVMNMEGEPTDTGDSTAVTTKSTKYDPVVEREEEMECDARRVSARATKGQHTRCDTAVAAKETRRGTVPTPEPKAQAAWGAWAPS
ncbi:MAG: hypothetical protein ACK4ZJ_15945, partial [Allorhizobium sp.]